MCAHVLLLLLLAVLAPLAAAYTWEYCGGTGKYTSNSTYQANLNELAAGLPKNASSSPTLFATGITGAVPNQVYALTLCRGDTTNASACLACGTQAFQDAQRLCPYDRDATIYYDACMLRFSNQNFVASAANSREMGFSGQENITSDGDRFERLVYELLNATAEYAAASSTRRFATGEVGFDARHPKIYALTQCTPDLTPAQCRSCLAGAMVAKRQLFPWNPLGAMILGERCNLRFEGYSFYNGTSMLQLPGEAAAPDTPAATEGKKRNVPTLVLAIALPIVAAITAIYLWFRRRRWRLTRKPPVHYATDREDMESVQSLIFDLSTLRVATDNFAESNKLGEGGFGAVYKGALPDGQEIAVKRLLQSSGQGIGELKNELVLVAKLQHKNLVRLVGVCLEEQEKILIYEYMPNRSLDTILFDSEKCKELDWGKRFKIINGVSRGLQYLHEDSRLKIVHRDLKASNVLLDSDMNPKISDFGLARLFGWNQSQDVTRRVVGTFGYMAPEYAMSGHYSIKSDVFSFGVLILEIVTGQRNTGSYNSERAVDLLSVIWGHWTMGTIRETLDPTLSGNYPGDELLKCVRIGLMCVQQDPAQRPLMSTVNVMLCSSSVSFQAPTRPAFCIQKSDASGSEENSDRYRGTYQSTSKSASTSPNEVSISELEPR